MRIVILQDQLRNGGTERQSLFLAHQFANHGHKITLLVFRPGGHLAGSPLSGDIQLRVLQRFDSGLSFLAPGLMRAVAAQAPDCVLCMGRTANCYAGFLQRRFPDVAVVGTLRTGKLLFPLHHWSMTKVRAVVANSNWWKRRLLDRRFPAERIHVVHNAVLLERSEHDRIAERNAMRAKFNISPETCIFLNVAGFRSGKRHRELLRICATIRTAYPQLDWRLWLVGDGRELAPCKRWVAANGLGTRVRFFHFQHDPFPFYAAADIAVSTSREDSLPNFLVEAQATRLPIVAYDCRGVAETCAHGSTGIIVPMDDRDRFVDAMVGFANDQPRRERFAAKAPAFAAERFSAQPQALAMLAFLSSLCPSPQP